MNRNKKLICLLSIIFMSFPAFSKQLSLQIIQHDGNEEKIINQSLIIEDELLNGLFDRGYIVTNSPAAVSTSESQDGVLLKTSLIEAKEGFSDYFIQIILYFAQNAQGFAKYDGLTQVKWSLYSIKTEKSVASNTIDNIEKIKNEEELRNISNDLLAYICREIK